MKGFNNHQDETTNNYILLSEVIFFLLAGIVILEYTKTTFDNFFSRIPILLAFLLLISLLIVIQDKTTKGFKYAVLLEFLVSIVYLFLILNLLRYEYQYLFKMTLIMPVIILSLKYGLKMAFFAAFLSISTTIYLSYLKNFATINADIILSGFMILLAWLLGQMTETQYEIRSKLQDEIEFRKQAENRQKEQLDFLQNLMDTIPNPVYYTNIDSVFIGCNKAFEVFFGTTREKIINKSLEDILPFVIAQKISVREMMLQSSGPPNMEFTMINNEGAILEVIFNNALIYNNEHQPTGLLGVIIDITEHKRLHKEIARVERLNLVGEMAAGIAHEIRNPITTVKGFLQLYQMNNNLTTLLDNVDLMIEELDRANTIITEYLSLAKGRRLNLLPKNLNEIITSIAPLLKADAAMSDNDISFDLNTIPPTLLDEDQIRQMLLNLCRNGLEAMDKGGTLTISTFFQDSDIVLKIKDQGKGIDPEIENKIGTPFVTNKEAGNGLGLAVCYSISARHNASITYETGPQGTVFYVKFKERLENC